MVASGGGLWVIGRPHGVEKHLLCPSVVTCQPHALEMLLGLYLARNPKPTQLNLHKPVDTQEARSLGPLAPGGPWGTLPIVPGWRSGLVVPGRGGGERKG